MTIWQTAIWLTLLFVLFSVALQMYAKRTDCKNASRVNIVIQQNDTLSLIIQELHSKITSLNEELEKLTSENKMLKDEVKKLYERVDSLQTHMKKPEDETSNN